jgi:hypothetical protein
LQCAKQDFHAETNDESVPMNLYLMAAAIGAALGLIWLLWLLAVRFFLRKTKSTPGALLSVIQVGVVLALMLAAYRVSNYCFGILGVSEPDTIRLFRRIWILIWAVTMVASIQIFLDIRRMAGRAYGTSGTQPVRRPASPHQKR